MALRSACNLAVKIRVFYKTGLPGSAHRATPVLRSLTLPLCRSTNERFRSSWQADPPQGFFTPRRPAPGSTFPLVSSSSTAFEETPTQSRASVVLKRRLFHTRSPLFSPSFQRLRGHTKAGVTSPRGVVTPAIPYTAICPASSPATFTFATRSLLPSPPPRTASPAGTLLLAQSRKSTVQERIIVPARCGRSCRWPTRCRRNREPQSGRCHRQYRPSAGRSSLRP